jgi:hypothetical protein
VGLDPGAVDEITSGEPAPGGARPVVLALAAAAVVLTFVVGAVVLRQADDDEAGGTAAPAEEGSDLQVFMNPNATDAQISLVAERLRTDPMVVSVRYVDQEEAFAEFRDLHVNDRVASASLAIDGAVEAARVREHVEALRAVLVAIDPGVSPYR